MLEQKVSHSGIGDIGGDLGFKGERLSTFWAKVGGGGIPPLGETLIKCHPTSSNNIQQVGSMLGD